jgi:hypothetical protein
MACASRRNYCQLQQVKQAPGTEGDRTAVAQRLPREIDHCPTTSTSPG